MSQFRTKPARHQDGGAWSRRLSASRMENGLRHQRWLLIPSKAGHITSKKCAKSTALLSTNHH